MERNYTAFISYRHKPLDMAVAEKLHQVIEGYRIPRALAGERKKLGLVFRDKEELPVSGDLNKDICEALDHSENLIVVCSPDTPGSRWVRNEIAYFLEKHDRSHLFAVLAKGEPEDSFPALLTHPDPENPERMVEPLAADVRDETIAGSVRKVRAESTRLFAGMLGVPYDSLVRREQKRKIRRAAVAGGIAAAVLLGYAGFMMYSNRVISDKNAELENSNRVINAQNEELQNSNQIIISQNEELQEQNWTISAQKAELQKNESRLLTEAALTEMAGGTRDMQTVLRNLADALPGEGNERPYYAPAEAALMEMFDLFGSAESKEYVIEKVIKQETPIYYFIVSDDGRTCYTLDRYGSVACYDLATTEKKWQVDQIGKDMYYNDALAMENDIIIKSDRETGRLYVGMRGIKALDAETGEMLWDYDPGRTFQVSRDGTRIVTLAMDVDIWADECSLLVILDSATGQVLHEIRSENSNVLQMNMAGCDGTDNRIAATLTGSNGSSIVLIDPDAGTITPVYQIPVEYEWHEGSMEDWRDWILFYDAAEKQILAAGPTYGTTTDVLCVSTEGDGLLWSKEIAEIVFEKDWRDKTGIMRMIDPDSSVSEEPAENISAAERYAVRLSEKDSRQLLITRTIMVQNPSWGQKLNVAFKEKLKNGSLMVPVYYAAVDGKTIWLDAQGFSQTSYLQVRIDTETGDAESAMIQLGTGMSNAGFASFSTAQTTDRQKTVLTRAGCDSIFLADHTDGTVKILWNAKEENTEEIADAEGGKVHQNGAMNRIARQADGSALAAECGWDNQLHIWKDGEEWMTVSLPADMRWRQSVEEEFGNYIYRTLRVSGRGMILMSDYTGSTETNRMSRFAIYNTGSREWRFVKDQAQGGVYRNILFFSRSDLFATVDEDSRIRIYDPNAEEPVRTFSLPVPYMAVDHISLSAGDEYFALLTNDNQIIILDAESGEIRYREMLSPEQDRSLKYYEYSKDTIGAPSLYVDEPYQRLYIAFSNITDPPYPGRCIDLRSWEKLSDIEGMLAFCPEYGTVLQYQNDRLVLRYVPTPEALAEAARSALEGGQETEPE